jgi:hypothetical protein
MNRNAGAASVLALALALAGCQQTASAPPAPPPGAVPGVTPNTFSMPAGTGCSGEISRFRAVLANDVATGNAAQSVANRAGPDLDRASSVCAAGREAEARSILSSLKARLGYG